MHVIQSRIYCAVVVLNKVMSELLISLAIDHDDSSSKKSSVALAEILSKNKDDLKTLDSLRFAENKRKVYNPTYPSQNVLNGHVDISSFDITLQHDILTCISGFQTVRKNPNLKKYICQDPLHEKGCCSKCDHACDKCGNTPNCRKKCCKDPKAKKCNHPCQTCTETLRDCKDNGIVCCKTCNTCKSCAKCLKSNNQCLLYKLKISIDMVNKLRNLAAHLTESVCKEFENGTRLFEHFPRQTDWASLSLHIVEHMFEVIIGFLSNSKYVNIPISSEHIHKLRHELNDVLNQLSREDMLRKYDKKISELLKLNDRIVEVEKNVVYLKGEVESMKGTVKQLCTDFYGSGEEPCKKIRVTIERVDHDGCLMKLPHQGSIKNVQVKRNSSSWKDINFIKIDDVWFHIKIKLKDEETFCFKVHLENGERKRHNVKSDDTKFVSSACEHESSAFNIGLICHTTGLQTSAHSVISNLDELVVAPPTKVKYHIHGKPKTVGIKKWHTDCEEFVDRNYTDQSVIKLPIDCLQDTPISRFASVLADWSKVKEAATNFGLVLTNYDTYKHAQFLGYDISDLQKMLHLDASAEERFDNRILVYKPAAHIVLNIRVLLSDNFVLLNQTMCICADDIKLQAMLHNDITCDSDVIFIGLVVVPSTDSLNFGESICKPCLRLLLSYDDLKDVPSFERWEKKNMVWLVKGLQKAHGLKNIKKTFWKLYSCRVIGFMATAEAFLPSIRAIALQSLAADVSTQVKTVLLTKEQQEVLFTPHKKLILVGSFGSGKSILGQLKVEQLYERAKAITKIYYICCESQCLFKSTMKQIANRVISRGNNSYVDIIVKSLEEVQNDLNLDKNVGISEVMRKIFATAKKERVHFVFDEYDAEKLDKIEATSIYNVVKTDSSIVHNSSIMLITQSLEKHREYIKTDAKGEPVSHKHEKYQFDLTGFKTVELLQTMRTTNCINKLTKICIEKISVNANIFNHPQFTENDSRDAKQKFQKEKRTAVYPAGSPTKKAVPVQPQTLRKQSKHLGEVSKARLTTKERNFQVTPWERFPESAAASISSENSSSGESVQSFVRNHSSSKQKVQQDSVVKQEHNSNASITESKEDLQNLDVLFKLLDVNDISTNEKTRTNFKFKGTSILGHNILGDKPMLIQLDTNSICGKQKNKGSQTFKANWKIMTYSICLLSVLMELFHLMKGMVILCYDQYAVVIAEKLINELKKTSIEYIPALNSKHRLKSKGDIVASFTSTDAVLITDFMGFMGMEADKVLVFVDKSDHFLKQHLVESLGRCTDELVIVEYDNPLTENKPDETLEEIIKEWKDNELVHNVIVEGVHGELDDELLVELSKNESKTNYGFNSNSSCFSKKVDSLKFVENLKGKLLFSGEMAAEKREFLRSILHVPFREDITSGNEIVKKTSRITSLQRSFQDEDLNVIDFVNKKHIGEIIGKGGKNIKLLQKEFGVNLTVNSNDGKIYVKGNARSKKVKVRTYFRQFLFRKQSRKSYKRYYKTFFIGLQDNDNITMVKTGCLHSGNHCEIQMLKDVLVVQKSLANILNFQPAIEKVFADAKVELMDNEHMIYDFLIHHGAMHYNCKDGPCTPQNLRDCKVIFEKLNSTGLEFDNLEFQRCEKSFVRVDFRIYTPEPITELRYVVFLNQELTSFITCEQVGQDIHFYYPKGIAPGPGYICVEKYNIANFDIVDPRTNTSTRILANAYRSDLSSLQVVKAHMETLKTFLESIQICKEEPTGLTFLEIPDGYMISYMRRSNRSAYKLAKSTILRTSEELITVRDGICVNDKEKDLFLCSETLQTRDWKVYDALSALEEMFLCSDKFLK